MKRLRLALAIAGTLLFAALAVAAEDGKPKEKRKGPKLNPVAETFLRIDRIKSAVESLDLKQEQQEKLAGIRDEFEAKRKAIEEKIGDLLTEDQRRIGREKLEDIQKAGKLDRQAYQQLEEAIKLTDEQKQKLEPIGKELQELVGATLKQVMQVLTPEQREQLQQKLGMGKKGRKGEKKKDQ
jgi:Spy/CpxP family protein refolding chaperone